MTLQLVETVVPPHEIRRVFEELWPIAAEMIDRARPALTDALIEVAGEWLRIGGDYDHPFGQSHAPECVTAAKEVGEALVTGLASSPTLSLGNRIRLRSMAELHGIPIRVASHKNSNCSSEN